jgi:hypothetical protein
MAQGEWEATTGFITAALEILEQENPMTVRQLFYRLVSVGHIQNTTPDYQRVSRLIAKCRRDDRCPYEWIVDRSRPTYQPSVWRDPAGYAKSVKRWYRKDYWATQPEYVEIWSEKDSVIGSIQDLTDELGIIVRVGRGFQSVTRINDVAKHLVNIRKPKTVLYLGDWDPSGESIQRAPHAGIQERAEQFAQVGDYSRSAFTVERVAIHKADIAIFNLPPLLIKRKENGDYKDSRAKKFVQQHGEDCVELDALPPTELRRRIRVEVEKRLDLVRWKRAIEIEKVELSSIVETVSKWGLGV